MREIFTVTARDPQNEAAAQGVTDLLHTLMEPYWPGWEDRCRDLMLAEACYGVNSPQWHEALAAMQTAKDEIVAQITAAMEERE